MSNVIKKSGCFLLLTDYFMPNDNGVIYYFFI